MGNESWWQGCQLQVQKGMIPLQIIISILQWLTPYLIKFVDKHTDDWLELLYDKIGKRFVNKYCNYP